jgi:hypothetical protein
MEPVDPARCPLCGRDNACAMACATASAGCTTPRDCWCTRVVVAADVLRRVPAPAFGRACVCADCVRDAAASRPRA